MVALTGMAERQCGQSLVVGAAAGCGLFILFTCLTNRKITKAIMMKSKTVWRNTP